MKTKIDVLMFIIFSFSNIREIFETIFYIFALYVFILILFFINKFNLSIQIKHFEHGE